MRLDDHVGLSHITITARTYPTLLADEFRTGLFALWTDDLTLLARLVGVAFNGAKGAPAERVRSFAILQRFTRRHAPPLVTQMAGTPLMGIASPIVGSGHHLAPNAQRDRRRIAIGP